MTYHEPFNYFLTNFFFFFFYFLLGAYCNIETALSEYNSNPIVLCDPNAINCSCAFDCDTIPESFQSINYEKIYDLSNYEVLRSDSNNIICNDTTVKLGCYIDADNNPNPIDVACPKNKECIIDCGSTFKNIHFHDQRSLLF